MTREEIIAAAEATLILAGSSPRKETPTSLGIQHLADMLDRMRDPAFSMGKLNRWLGWMQAAVVAGSCGKVTLDDMKEINRPKDKELIQGSVGREFGLPQSPAQAVEGDKTRWMDRKDDLSDAIEASHPLNTGRHDLYQQAMMLVGNRHSKGGLVCLVNHLLAEADRLRAALSAEGSANAAAARLAAEEMRERAAEEDTARLNWLEANSNAEISYEGWEDDVWQVHTVNGGRNDREWTLRGEGATVREAIDAAIKTLRLRAEDQEKAKAAATPTIADPDGEARS